MHELLLHVSSLSCPINWECRGARGQATYWTWQTPKDAGATFSYQVQCFPDAKETAIAVAVRCAGRFILATNVLDIDELTDDDVLREYKAQQSTERGFRFLKDPLFYFQCLPQLHRASCGASNGHGFVPTCL